MAVTHSPAPPTGMPTQLHVGPPPAPDFPAPVSAGPPYPSNKDDSSLVRPLGAVQPQADHGERAETASANDLAAQRHELTLADKVPRPERPPLLWGAMYPSWWSPATRGTRRLRQAPAPATSTRSVQGTRPPVRQQSLPGGQVTISPHQKSVPARALIRSWLALDGFASLYFYGRSAPAQSPSSGPTTQLLFDRGPRDLTPPMPIVSGAQTLPVQPED